MILPGIFASSAKTGYDILVVAGGGSGGGQNNAGGGGAGGFILLPSQNLSFNTVYTVAIGAGGSGSASTGTNGANSSIVGGSVSQTAIGGGGGGGGSNGGNIAGSNGGSGGGASYGTASGGSPTSGQGNAGGSTNGTGTGIYPGAGGGGAGSAALNLTGGASVGNGGVGAGGISYTNYAILDAMGAATNTGVLSSSHYYYAGGGGGGGGSSAGTGGTGGGGNGEYVSALATAGAANSGGGGGGVSGVNGTGHSAPNGGSGVAIIRYAGLQKAYGGTPTTSGGYTYHTFTSSSNFYTGTTIPVTGYSLWMDASDSSTITQSSNLVSQWNDKSGNGYNFTSSGSLRPTYSAASQNGLSTLVFAGGQGLLTSSYPWASSAFTVITVQRLNATGTYYGIFETDVSGGVGFGVSGATNYYSLFKSRVNPNDFSGNVAPTSGKYDVTVFKSSGISGGSVTATAYKNGTSIGTASYTGGSTSSTSAIGYDGNTGDYSYMNLCEIIVYPSQLSDSDRNKVEGYLRAKWGTV